MKSVFPEILKYAFRALANEKRRIIVTALLRANKPMKFSEIKEATGIRDSYLAYHLKELEKGNIIEKYAKNGEVYYILTELGKKLIANILRTILEK